MSFSINKHPKLVIVVFFIGVIGWILVSPKPKKLVVYCAHDAVYSQKILTHFQQETGIRVEPRFDTEATKSLGLVELIIQEEEHPRCDVFWNNELLGTQDLHARGLLEPYKGSGYERIPEAFKDPDAHWVGFAARLRMMIANTDQHPADQVAITETLAGDLSRVAMAKPLFGTTLTHYAVLWKTLGAEGLKAWHEDARKRGLVVVPGNGPVVNMVSRGSCKLGFTDTDDYFVSKDRGDPVDAIPVRVADNKTICIPNTVSIIKGTKRRDEAEQLVDYLLSHRTEMRLARSPARQIPLGAMEDETLPSEVEQLRVWAQESVDLSDLLESRNAVLDWLRNPKS